MPDRSLHEFELEVGQVGTDWGGLKLEDLRVVLKSEAKPVWMGLEAGPTSLFEPLPCRHSILMVSYVVVSLFQPKGISDAIPDFLRVAHVFSPVRFLRLASVSFLYDFRRTSTLPMSPTRARVLPCQREHFGTFHVVIDGALLADGYVDQRVRGNV